MTDPQPSPPPDGPGATWSAFDAAPAASAPVRRARLIIQGRRHQPATGPLARLARLIGLDVWDESLLSRRAAQDMGVAALLLTVVLTFELLAWTMLINVLVHSAQWQISARSWIALLLGGVFAAGIFAFEKTFLTADFGEAAWRKWLGIGMRLVIIVGSLFATSQPIELLVFGGAIDNRLHDERALEEAIRQEREVEKLNLEAIPLSNAEVEKHLSSSDEGGRLDTQRNRRDDAQAALGRAHLAVGRAKARVQAAEQREHKAKSAVDAAARDRSHPSTPEELQRREQVRKDAAKGLVDARGESAAAAAALSAANEKERQAQQELETAKLNVINAEKDRMVYKEQVIEIVHKPAADAERALKEIKNWMFAVERAKPNETVHDASGRSLAPKQADFTDRLRALDDLRRGDAPLWPRTSPAARSRAAEDFDLEDPLHPDDLLTARRQRDAALFDRIYLIALVMAGVIPLLTLAFKSMMSSELQEYYSTRAQARAGNADAIEALAARGIRLSDLYDDDRGGGHGRD
jgi:hypothetical protein